MLAGEVISFVGNNMDPEVSLPTLIELTTKKGKSMKIQAPIQVRRCKHGVIYPHECKECEAEATPEEIATFMAAEGLAPNVQGNRLADTGDSKHD